MVAAIIKSRLLTLLKTYCSTSHLQSHPCFFILLACGGYKKIFLVWIVLCVFYYSWDFNVFNEWLVAENVMRWMNAMTCFNGTLISQADRVSVHEFWARRLNQPSTWRHDSVMDIEMRMCCRKGNFHLKKSPRFFALYAGSCLLITGELPSQFPAKHGGSNRQVANVNSAVKHDNISRTSNQFNNSYLGDGSY